MFLGAMLFASKPAAASCAGFTAFFTDVGCNGGGSYWFSDGVRWRGYGGHATLRVASGASATAGATAEILEQTSQLPAGLIQNGDSLIIEYGALKSNTVSTTTSSILLGATTATSETVVWTLPVPATTNAVVITKAVLTRVNATTIRRSTILGGAPYAQTASYPSDITVANMDSTALYLGLMFSNSGSETTTSKFCYMGLRT